MDKSEINGHGIEILIYRLRSAKNKLKEEFDDKNWGMTFELQTIALCEFALEHGYGIKLS